MPWSRADAHARPAWVKLATSLSTRTGCISTALAWHFQLADTAHWPRHMEVKVGTREAEPIYLPGLARVTGSYEILQQCLTGEKSWVLLLDKRINKIKSFSYHQWKIACHFNSTLKCEAGASSSFHLSCNAIIPAPNRDGAAVLGCSPVVQADRHPRVGIPHYTWASTPELPASARWKKSGTYFPPFICIIAKGVKSIWRAEDHSEGSSVDRIQRAQYALVLRWAREKRTLY